MNPADTALGLSTLQRVDQVRDQFERAWREGSSPRISEFLESQGSVFRAALLEVLLPLDVEYRRRAGQSSNVQSYLSELPNDAPVVARILGSRTPGDVKGAAATFDMATAQNSTWIPPAVGEKLEEFQILQELGRGAFGTVYRAWQTGVDREVALKVSRSRSHEPRTMAHLDGHPNIVRIYDEPVLPSRGLHLLYMEFVHGVTLREVLARRLALPEEERERATIAALTSSYDDLEVQPTPAGGDERTWTAQVCLMGAQIADALDFAHRRNVRHCDIKPANILLNDAGTPKLVDFNVSHRPNHEQLGVGGTLAYMSPEQLRAFRAVGQERADLAAQLDGRSDLYSLGIVLWEALVGYRPFVDVPGPARTFETLSAMVEQREQEPVRRALKALPKDFPRGVREVFARCLAESPEDRYATGSELAHHLRLCCDAELHDLLYPPQDSWRELSLHWAITFCMLLGFGLTFNVILSAINIFWNDQVLNQEHLVAFRWSFTWLLVPAINVFAYLGGGAAGIFFGWPIIRVLRDEATASTAVDNAVWLGHYSALVALASWIVAAIAYGVFVARGSGAAQDTIQVSASAILAGMIAAPLTFFPVTYVCTHIVLPRLLRESRHIPSLDIEGHLGFYLGLLLFVPLFAIGASQLAPGGVEGFRLMLLALVLIDVIGLSLALWCFLGIRRDLALLEKVRFRRSE